MLFLMQFDAEQHRLMEDACLTRVLLMFSQQNIFDKCNYD
jgi:hypothetical protein